DQPSVASDDTTTATDQLLVAPSTTIVAVKDSNTELTLSSTSARIVQTSFTEQAEDLPVDTAAHPSQSNGRQDNTTHDTSNHNVNYNSTTNIVVEYNDKVHKKVSALCDNKNPLRLLEYLGDSMWVRPPDPTLALRGPNKRLVPNAYYQPDIFVLALY
ncbi:hypothetical protein SARC_16489, partial [Sphaeroforma arctica JP610]